MSDMIGNFLTIIRNAIAVSKRSVEVPHSRMREAIAAVLKLEGFIRDYEVSVNEDNHKRLTVQLKYLNGESAIHELKRISKPGLRRYAGSNNIEPVISGLGISVLTTNRGVITDKQARKMAVGGEIICQVW